MNPRHALQDFHLHESQKHLLKDDDEEMVTVCSDCGTPTHEDTYSCGNGWDGITICPGCGTIEGDTEQVTESDLL